MTPRKRPLLFKNNLHHDEEMDRWHVRKMVNGRVIQRSFPTKRRAVGFLEALVDDAIAAAYGLELDDTPRTIDDVFEEYIDERQLYGRSSETINGYRWAQKNIVNHFGASHSPVLSRNKVNEYVRARQASGVSNKAIVRELKLYRTVVRHVVGDQALPWQVPSLAVPPSARVMPSDDEIRAIWQALAGREDVRTAIVLAVLTGMRSTDVLRAGPSWRRDDLLDVPMSKRHGIVNTLPLVATLRTHLKTRTGALYVGCSASAVKMVLQRLTTPKKGEKATVAAAKPWRGIGHLRHVCATWAAQAGHDEESVGLVLGHAGRSVARRHYITDEGVETKRKVLESVEKRWKLVFTKRHHRAVEKASNLVEFVKPENRKCL